jgi:hypothetical protein
MADKSNKPIEAAPCCAETVILDTNDTYRRCVGCGAEWTRDTREGDWKPVVKSK